MDTSDCETALQQRDRYTCFKNFRHLLLFMIAVMVFLISFSYLLCSDGRDSMGLVHSFFRQQLTRINENAIDAFKKQPATMNGPPILLLWTPYFSETGNWFPKSFTCPDVDCLIKADRNLLNISAAVIFHWRSVNISDLPPKNDPKQRWILYNEEAPPHTDASILSVIEKKIDWTVTYRMDSDIYAPYASIVPREFPVPVPTPPTGRRLVCWLVSNCKTPGKREEYVELLKEFIPVDIYGNCGPSKCPVQDRPDCYRALSQRCKFYLSFENSICKDYSTEKVYNALDTDMVPVVMGGANYTNVLPSRSYIDALSFAGPEQLAKYLLELDKDEKKYLSYLAWKKNFKVMDESYIWACEVCRRLHQNNTKIQKDLHYWWYDLSSCTSWDVIQSSKNHNNAVK